MDPRWGWPLAVAALVIGWMQWGWQGLVMGATIVAFWLVLQFSRAMRVMRDAGQAPVGHVKSAVMMNAKLKPGLRIIDVVQMTRSLGEQLSAQPERWRWHDDGGDAVELEFTRGRLVRWTLQRAPAADGGAADTAA